MNDLSEIDCEELETALFIREIVDSIIEKVFFSSERGAPALNRGTRYE